jgi:transcriptional regulator with XRE-family HTH domain
MEIKQPEIIQILRKRANMNQGTFGAKAFDTSFESGRTKVKNIELGKQIPTARDLKNMARVLDVPVEELIPGAGPANAAAGNPGDMIYIHNKVLDFFPGIGPYLEMLNKAVTLNDRELVSYLAEKIADLFHTQPPVEASLRVK